MREERKKEKRRKRLFRLREREDGLGGQREGGSEEKLLFDRAILVQD